VEIIFLFFQKEKYCNGKREKWLLKTQNVLLQKIKKKGQTNKSLSLIFIE
jgi:hypothetical protein